MSTVVIDDREWRKLRAKIARSAKAHVKVGVLASKGGNAEHSGGVSLIELAAIHEFGSPAAGIPQRSFIRSTVTNGSRKIATTLGKLAKSIIADRLTHKQALDILGLKVTAMIKNTVKAGTHLEPALKPATIAAKGSTRPLVDTGRLINSVQHQVID
jgi:phage gpG-like protein